MDDGSGLGGRANGDVCMSDRLIPSRGSCSEVRQLKLERDENWAPQNEYHEVLSQNVLGKEALSNVKILSYQHKPMKQEPTLSELRVLYSSNRDGTKNGVRTCRQLPQSAAKVLDAPGMLDDFYSHPIDWSSQNVVAVALSDMVFLFHAATGSTQKLLQLSSGSVTTLRWTEAGGHLSVGASSGEVQIWDAVAQRQLRNLRGHAGRVGALAWHTHMLSSGCADAEIHQHDVRVRDHLVNRMTSHADLVCGLDYNCEGMLASGGNDNLVCIWETPTSSSPLHTFTEHQAAVKAIRWCPWQRHVLATGGGSADRQVCLWNAASGRMLMSTHAESQVTGIIWGQQERELLTAHGYSRNQLSLWKYPSLVKVGDLEGHEGRLLGLAQSPDGSLVCSSSADETLRFWRVFSPVGADKRASNSQTTNNILKTIR
ncbi:cdc20 [Symbiodinium natans]|uniref:Cdc20 protein n=1 Tax=Symbiodinium natans TaxID=878477 RepID=A0A812L1A3_9DINO|nr:cdc20 [Symbiodinium natans]